MLLLITVKIFAGFCRTGFATDCQKTQASAAMWVHLPRSSTTKLKKLIDSYKAATGMY